LILDRYLLREIGKPLILVLGVLAILFGSFSGARFLADAVNGLLPTDTIVLLIALKVLISLEVLIPISLYLAVILAYGRLHSESEITALLALRGTPWSVVRPVLILSVLLALGVATLSLTLRPWAYQRLHEMSNAAAASINVDHMEAGTFYESADGRRVIFIGHRNGAGHPASDVFMQLTLHHRLQIVHARTARQLAQGHGSPTIAFQDAHIVQPGLQPGEDDRVVDAAQMTLHLEAPAIEPLHYSSLAASSATLARSDSHRDIAELQWRLSTPLSTLLLGLLGVPLSRSQPRQGRYAKMGVAILIYAGYYLLCTSARTWLQQGKVDAFPGLWWAPALLALVLAISALAPRLHLDLRLGRLGR
jgi:Predicted permeases